MPRSKEEHNWVEDGMDVMGDKDYRCSKCKAWASRTLELWSPGGCSGKPIEEVEKVKE